MGESEHDSRDPLGRCLELLGGLSQAIQGAGDLEALGRAAYREFSRLLDTTGFILALFDEPSRLVTVAYQVDSGTELPGGSFPLGNGFTSQVIQSRAPLLIRHWEREGPHVQIRYATDQKGLPQSAVIVPLLLGDQVIGALSFQSYLPAAYDEEDLRAVQVVATSMALAIQNLRLSQRLDAQLQLRVSELEAIIEHMADALLIVDPRGCIVRLNRVARELLSAPQNSVLLGRPLAAETVEEWPAEARAVGRALVPVIQALQEGRSLNDHEVLIHMQGRKILSLSCKPQRDAAGELAGGVVVFRDVTGRRDIERLKDEVLSIASHDLKGPITVMKGHVRLIQRQYQRGEPDPDRVARGWQIIEGQCDRLVEMLNLLLDFSRIEAGRLQIQRATMDLARTVRRMSEEISATTDQHSLEVSAPDILIGAWDEKRLEQVLRNLLINAVKYSPDGGTVRVELTTSENEVTVSVQDQGIGLAREELAHIFERFYRTEGARKLEGSGLGLFICDQIVSAHGGRIWAESDGLGQGSTFCFTLS